jgi:autotransporter-associated beta strand protein
LTGNLVVGDGQGAANDTALWQNDNQLGANSQVTVNGGGIMNLGSHTETVAALTINDGLAMTGDNGNLTINGPLAMTGGTLNTGAAGTVTLKGNVTATSDGAAAINGSGSLSLGGATRTFTINPGTTAGTGDLVVWVPITSTTGEGLTKNGLGSLNLKVASTYAGGTLVQAGALLIDGSVTSLVTINGGTVAGGGTALGGISVANSGTLEPGDLGGGTGNLTIGTGGNNANLSMATGATYTVQATNSSTFSTLAINGNLDLDNNNMGGATIAAAFPSQNFVPQLGQPITIITFTGTRHGKFVNANAKGQVNLGGHLFLISYLANSVTITPM